MRRKATTAFWQGVCASVLASIAFEGLKFLSARAERAAESADVRVGDTVPPLAFLDDLPPFLRLGAVALAALLVAWGVYLLVRGLSARTALVLLPVVAVVAVGVTYVWLM